MTDKAKSDAADSDMRMMQVTHDHLLNEAVKITQPADGYRVGTCLLYTSPSPRDGLLSRMPSSA